MAVAMGEGHAKLVEELVQGLLEFYGGRGELTRPGVAGEGGGEVEGSLLSYPGKVAVAGELVVISDTGHHRVLVTDTAGAVLEVVGGLEAGDMDGGLTESRFSSPQGVCLVGSKVWVCDTDNNKLKYIDLDTRQVGSVTAPGVSSPWDCCHLSSPDRGEVLLVAMAGSHQVWLLALSHVTWWKGVQYSAGMLVSVVGSGAEENRNNSYPHKAGLAQPSGISCDQEYIYLADSESSSVRRISLQDGAVTNVAGGERDPTNLFAYGDIDGAGVAAKLQHPLGVSVDREHQLVYIADSYNHKIKRAQLEGKLHKVTTVQSGLTEPGGLCYVPDKNRLYIADTNSHSVKVLEVDTGSLYTLFLTTEQTDSPDRDSLLRRSHHEVSSQAGQVKMTAGLGLRPGHHLNSEATSSWRLTCSSLDWQCPAGGEISGEGLSVLLSHPALTPGHQTHLELSVRLYVCTDTGLCLVNTAKIILTLTAVTQSVQDVDLGPLLES